MNKTPEQMKINDALDLFEENGAKIAFFNGRCNIDEQFGKVMRKRRLYAPSTDEEKLLVAQLGKASDLIYEMLRDKTKKQNLIELLALREQYRPKANGEQEEPRKDVPREQRPKDERQKSDRRDAPKDQRQKNERTAKGQTGERRTDGHAGERRTDGRKTEATGRNNNGQTEFDRRHQNGTGYRGSQGNNGNTQNSQGNTGNKSVEYVRGKGEKGEGNKVKIIEIAPDKGITVPLKEGGKIKFNPPTVTPEARENLKVKANGFPIPNVKRYLVIEVTPDEKTKFFNIVYGDLDLNQMNSNPRYLKLCMTKLLERKRINDICRNSFCALDDLLMDNARNVYTSPNKATVYLAGQALITHADEIRTTRKTTFMDSLFGNNRSAQDNENVLRIFKTGTIIICGKECSIYSYAVKDETVDMKERVLPEIGCFIVSGFDEERFVRDARYREMVVTNVFTPSRLKNSRRADIAYPYIGSVTSTGDFKNDFEIYEELQGMQKQL